MADRAPAHRSGGVASLRRPSSDLLRTIGTLLPRASLVVHAGDPDREGQLLVDEVLEFLGYKGPVDRLLISDLNLPAVRRSLAGSSRTRDTGGSTRRRSPANARTGFLRNQPDTPLHHPRAGWRLRRGPVGRAGADATPRTDRPARYRDRAIQTAAVLRRSRRGSRRRPEHPLNQASAGRGDRRSRRRWPARSIVSTPKAIRTRVEGRAGQVTKCSRVREIPPPPWHPYSLPDLQVDAGKRLGLGPKQTLDACQSLYETHRMLTYPRSDCPYLPEGQHDQAIAVFAAIAANIPALVPAASAADRSQRSRAWNDKKVTAHHAISPTVVAKPIGVLTPTERGIYDLVARRYLAQFHPAFEYQETKIEIAIEGERFRAIGRQTVAEGWRALIPKVEADEDPEKGNTARRGDRGRAAAPPGRRGDRMQPT